MTVLAHLCGIAGEAYEVTAGTAAAIRAHVADAAAKGFALVEPDLPVGRLALPRNVVDRAVLAVLARGGARPLLFARGPERIAKVKAERIFDLRLELREAFGGPPLVLAAVAVLAAGPMPGKELLRAARARNGAVSASDGPDLAKALVRAWNDGLVQLS